MTELSHPWFRDARYGMFVHWGPYAAWERGEQILFREQLDQQEYEQRACDWNPQHFDAAHWAKVAADGGFKYSTLTTRHHDGYCLWDSKLTDYTSMKQAPKRDFVGEWVDACRKEGLRVGLYYSLADWRVPAYWEGPEHDSEGWEQFREYVHGQIRELLTDYGQIDVLWFDGPWPRTADEWRMAELVKMIRTLQPGILINNRLDVAKTFAAGDKEAPGASESLGDFSTPEHEIVADPNRMWESCQVSTWRLWGYARGERWREVDVMLDMLVESAGDGGNLLMNVGPDGDGRIPQQFIERSDAIGQWLKIHGEAVYGSEAGDVCDFVTYGRQTKKGNNLYLIVRFWDGSGEVRLTGLATRVTQAILLTTGKEVEFEQTGNHVIIKDLPHESPTALFAVIKMVCENPPQAQPWAVDRLWQGDARRFTTWAAARGTSVNACR